jgi:membrane fusion protein (multidrug efflux system)
MTKILPILLPAILVSLVLGACSKEAPPSAPPPAVEVGVIVTRAQPIQVVNDYVGRIAAFRSVEQRARVQGIVDKRLFVEGTDVKKGDPLYLIDPAEYQQSVNDRAGALARAQADLVNAKGRADRLAPLVAEDAISRQDYDDAVSSAKQAEAAVISAQASLDKAKIDLSYTRLTATESGRIGQTLVPEGRLVGKDGPTHMATIDQIDKVYVIFTLSDRDSLLLRRAIEAGRIREGQSAGNVRVFLPDDTEYAQGGRLDFSDQQVNPDTGTITLRAILPNPARELLPGMFVHVSLTAGTRPDAILVPQQAVIKTPTGHLLWVVDKDGKVEQRPLVVGPWHDNDWIIEKGVAAGETVIVDGVQKVKAGMTVKTVPWSAPAAPRTTPLVVPAKSAPAAAGAPGNAPGNAPASAAKSGAATAPAAAAKK